MGIVFSNTVSYWWKELYFF